MATYYWVGGSGNWDSNSTANWASSSGGTPNAGVPTYLDDVVFDANSNTGTDPFTVTVTGTSALPAICNDFTASGLDGAMTLSMSATAFLDCYGSINLPATNFSVSAISGSAVVFRAVTTGKTVTTNGVSFSAANIIFNGIGGGWTLGSALSLAGVVEVVAGTFSTSSSNYSISANRLQTAGTSTKVITLNASTLTLSGGTFSINLTGSGVTLNAGTSSITCLGSSGAFFANTGYTFYNVTLGGTTAGTTAVSGAHTFNNLTINAPTTGTNAVTFAADQVINGTFTSAGTSGAAKVQLSSSVAGTQRTITAAAVSITFTNLQDIVAAGASAPWTLAGGNGNLGNNGNITFNNSPLYWIGGSGNWSDGTKWSTSSGGSAANYAPSAQNSVIFDVNSNVGTGAFTVTVDGISASPSVCNDFTASGLDGTMTLSMGATAVLDIYGSMALPATNFAFSGTVGCLARFLATSSGKTITTNGINLGSTLTIQLSGIGGEWTLGSAVTSVASFNVLSGTFNTGNYNLTGNFTSTGNLARTINMGSSSFSSGGGTGYVFSGTNLTFNAGTSTITMSNASPTFAGGGLTFNNVSFTSNAGGTTTISGVNTFNNLSQTSRAATGFRTITLSDNQTVSGTLTLGAANTAVRRIQVQSSVVGTQRTITLNGTLATLNDVDFKDIATAGSAGTWTGTRIGDGTNNSGITFSAPKTVYWNLAAGGLWSATAWAASSGGTPDANNFPLAQDTAIIENTGLNTSATITLDSWWLGNIDCSTRSNAYTLSWGNFDPFIFGNFTLSSAATVTSATSPTLNFYHNSGTRTINTAGVSFPVAVQMFCFAGTVQLVGNLNTSGIANAFVLNNGTLDLNNNTLTCALFASNNANTRAIAFGGSGKIVLTGNAATIWNVLTATGFTVTGTPVVDATYSGATGTRRFDFAPAGEANAISLNVTAGSDILDLRTTSGAYKNINFTGFSGSASLINSIVVFGNLTLSSGMTMNSSTGSLTFSASSGVQQLTTNGKTLENNINKAGGGTLQLLDSLTIGSSRTLTLSNGTLDVGSNNVSVGFFNSNNSSTRTLNMGSGTWTLTGTGTIWDLARITGLTFNRGTANITATGSGTLTFNGGADLVYNSLSYTNTSQNSIIHSNNNTFTNLSIAPPASAGITSFVPTDLVITGTFTLGSGSSENRRIRFRSPNPVANIVVTANTVSLANVDFIGVTAAGTSSPWSGTNLGNVGNNVNINFAAPKTVYWSLPAGGTWSDTAWATSSGGTPSAANFPLPQDTAIVDDTGLNLNGTITVLSNFSIPNLSFATRTLAMTYNPQSAVTYYGDLTFSSAVNFVTSSTSSFGTSGTQNITSAGKTFFGIISIFNYGTGTVRLVDNLTCSNTSGITLTVGNLDLNNNTITAFLFNSNNSNTRSIAFGTGKFSLYGNGATVWTTALATGLTYTGTPTVDFTYTGSAGSRTIRHGSTGGGTETNSPDIYIKAGRDTVSFISVCRTFDFTGFSGNLENGLRTVYGNLIFSSTMTAAGGTNATTFAATSGTQQITTNGLTLDFPVTQNGIGGTVQLQDNLTMGSTRTFTLTAGTLNLVSRTLSSGIFSSSNSNVRSIAFGTGNITVTGNGTTVWTTSTATNFTYTGTPTVNATYAGATGTRTISHGTAANATEANTPNFYVSAGTDTVDVRTSGTLDFTGFSGTFTNATRTIFKNLIFSAGMTVSAGASITTFAATSGTQQITTNGRTLDFPLTVAAPGATVSLQDALTLGSTRTLTLTSGTLTTNNYNVTTGAFSSSNANVRTLNMGSSTWTITGAGGVGSVANVWNANDSTNLTLNSGTSTINITHGGAVSTTAFLGGNQTYYNLINSNTNVGIRFDIRGDNTFNNLTYPTPSLPGINQYSVYGSQVVNGTLTISGANGNQRVLLTSTPIGAGALSITAASVSTLTDVDFRSITALGAAIPWSGTRLGNCGGNTNINFGAGKNVYWNQVAGGNWYDNAWALTSGGAVATTNFPLPQDTAIFDNTGLNASTTITVPTVHVGTIDFSVLTNSTTLDTAGVVALYKDLTLSSAVTLANTGGSSGGFFFAGQTTNQNLTSAGRTFVQEVIAQGPGVSLVLVDTFVSTNDLSLIYGTLDLNGQLVTADTFTGTGIYARTLAFNGSYLEITGNDKTVWDCSDLTNFSYTGTPDVRFTYSGSTGARTCFNGNTAGATESNVVDFNITAGTDTFTWFTGSSTGSMNYTGFSGTGTTIRSGFIYRNLTLSPTMTIAPLATPTDSPTTFAATSGTQVITSNGVLIDRSLIVDAPGATVQLADALTMGSGKILTLTQGTLDSNNYNVTVGVFDSNLTSPRVLNMGSSTWTILNAANDAGAWSMAATNLTINSGTSTIIMNSPTETSFVPGSQTYNKVTQASTAVLKIGGSGTYGTLDNSVVPTTVLFGPAFPTTVNNFNYLGTLGNLVTIGSIVPGNQFTLVKSPSNNETVSFCSISDSNATPYGCWFAPTSQGNVDGGNNTGWNFGAAGASGTGMMLLL